MDSKKMKVSVFIDPLAVTAYPKALDYIAFRVHQQGRSQKSIAADMDYSPSDLARKLSGNPDDPRCFTVNDLERFIQVTGDKSVIEYLVAKYLADASREAILEQISQLKKQLSETEQH